MIASATSADLRRARALLDAGARRDGDPDAEDIPLRHACWRGRAEMTRELIARGAALTFRGGGSAIGAEIVRMLLAAGATVPERVGENGARGTMLIAELGIDAPA